jgi:hypothetical protein
VRLAPKQLCSQTLSRTTFAQHNPVRVVDAFVDELDLLKLGFGGMEPEATGRPAYHPATL